MAAKRTPEARRKAREKSLERFDPAKHRERTNNMPHRSKYEDQVLEFVSSLYSGPIQQQAHVFPENPKSELDIFLPEIRVGIEVQGDYWHSKPEVYLLDRKKRERCLESGISLFVLWVSDWKTKYSDERAETERRLRDFVLKGVEGVEAPYIAESSPRSLEFSHEDDLPFLGCSGEVGEQQIDGLH